MQRHDHRIPAEGIVLRGQLHQAGSRFLAADPGDGEAVQAGRSGRRRIGGGAHLPGESGQCGGVTGLLLVHPAPQGRSLVWIGRAQIVAQQRPHPSRRQCQFEILLRSGRSRQPAADGQRHRPVGGEVGIGADPVKRGETVEGGRRDFPRHFCEQLLCLASRLLVRQSLDPRLDRPQ